MIKMIFKTFIFGVLLLNTSQIQAQNCDPYHDHTENVLDILSYPASTDGCLEPVGGKYPLTFEQGQNPNSNQCCFLMCNNSNDDFEIRIFQECGRRDETFYIAPGECDAFHRKYCHASFIQLEIQSINCTAYGEFMLNCS